MILAAGRGERMRPLTDTSPKPLLKVQGKALIEYHIENLVKAGVKEIVINHAWLGHMLPEQLGDGSRWGINISYSAEGALGLETAGGIINALPLLGDEPFILVNGDIFCDFDFSQLRSDTDSLVHLVMVPNPVQHPEGDFFLQDGRLVDQGCEKYTYSGIGVYSPSFFTGMSIERRALGPLLRQGIQSNTISGQLHQGEWRDIGTPERLAQLNKDLGASA